MPKNELDQLLEAHNVAQAAADAKKAVPVIPHIEFEEGFESVVFPIKKEKVITIIPGMLAVRIPIRNS